MSTVMKRYAVRVVAVVLCITMFTACNLDVKGCYLTSWDTDKQELIAVFGTLPVVFDPAESGGDDNEGYTCVSGG